MCRRYVAFLCARLLEVSVEERALHIIQKHWRLSRLRRAGHRPRTLACIYALWTVSVCQLSDASS